MLAKRVIACLDVKDGRVVKGIQFLDLRDAGDPAELAAAYNREGVDEVIFLDITASSEKRNLIVETVVRTARQVFIPLAVGGGIRSVADARGILTSGADKVSVNTAAVGRPGLVSGLSEVVGWAAVGGGIRPVADAPGILTSGADKVSVNTAAVERPELITELSEEFGSQAVVLAIDARRDGGGWRGYTYGGRTPTRLSAVEWAMEGEAFGAGEILLTSMDRDGTEKGFDCELTRAISPAVKIPVIASGGAGSPQHFAQVLTEGEADAALAASIFHYGKVRGRDLKN